MYKWMITFTKYSSNGFINKSEYFFDQLNIETHIRTMRAKMFNTYNTFRLNIKEWLWRACYSTYFLHLIFGLFYENYNSLEFQRSLIVILFALITFLLIDDVAFIRNEKDGVGLRMKSFGWNSIPLLVIRVMSEFSQNSWAFDIENKFIWNK